MPTGPDREGFSSRREFIRSLAAISAGLTVAAPLGRAANLAEKSIPKGAPSDPGGTQGWAEIKLQVNGNTEPGAITDKSGRLFVARYPSQRWTESNHELKSNSVTDVLTAPALAETPNAERRTPLKR
jgi:hypothetical protein